ncbi:MAG: ABC transporter permease, partial [Dehalococcoidales bacterium]
MTAILRKELADYFTSIRFIILFTLMLFVSAGGLRAASEGIRGANLPEGFVFLGLFTTAGSLIPSVTNLLVLLVPIIGIALGFDAINSERTGGTLSRILSQPLYRDSVINGKFLAGIVTLVVMVGASVLLISGYGLRMIGVPPTAEEVIRLFMYFVLTIIYGAFWMGLAMLFSILLRRISSSLLISLGIWIFFSIFILLVAPAIANAFIPTADATQAELVRNGELARMITRISPNVLYQEATAGLLLPMVVGSLGMLSMSQVAYMIPNPLSMGQSILLIWPHLTGLVSLSLICFAASYVLFMRQEIRAT